MKAPVKKKLDRPKSGATKEQERVEAMLKTVPEHRRMTAEERKNVFAAIAASDAMAARILKDHKSPPMPAHLVYDIESTSPEVMTPPQIRATVEEYTRVAKNIQKGQVTGGKTLADRAAVRREKVLIKNAPLIQRLKAGKWSVNRVATKLHDEWDVIPPRNFLPDESKISSARGDGSQRPTIRTLRRWLETI